MEPLYEGLLLGRKFFIDPEGTFTGEQVSGIDDFYDNLETAQRLRGLLERGGARCFLSLREMSDSDKLKAIEEYGPVIYISIGRAPSPSIRHCSGSLGGERLAESISGRFSSPPEVERADEYLLVQTSMVAVEALFPDGGAVSPAEEAAAVFDGILDYLSEDADG